jgi:hypothetical protein
MQTRTKVALLLFAGLAGFLAYVRWHTPSDKAPTPLASTVPSSSAAPVASTAPPLASDAATTSATNAVALDAGTLPPPIVRARWGSGFDDLGRSRPQEGNAEAPMSLALAGDDVIVLDQVNGRVVRFDKGGRRVGAQPATVTTQDVAIAGDGTMALLDRLADRKVTLVTPDNRRLELPLAEGTTGEPGLLTGLFVDGTDVYVEKEHGALVRVGTTDGKTDLEPKTLSGRPSKDGALLLTAAFVDQSEGKTVLNAFDRRKGALRFARQISFPRPAHAIVLLDSDAAGTLMLGVSVGATPELSVVCMDPADGRPTGKVVIPLSQVAEETFRDVAVRPDGTIVYAHRTEEGVEIRTARCA